MVHLPASSPVLQRRRGYKEVYGHFAKLRLATRIPLKTDLMHTLLDAKDIATLYELWCFFTLVSAVQHCLGEPVRAGGVRYDDTEVGIAWDMEVAWSDGTHLLYNPRFSRSRPHKRRSYSVPLRPDIALQVPAGANEGLHFFDAKFRVDSLNTVMPLDTNDEEGSGATEERRGTFKRGDLYKMHTYRDAIPHACSVWILYPGTQFRFFGSDTSPIIFSATDLQTPVNGVGASPLLPDEHRHADVQQVVCRLLNKAT